MKKIKNITIIVFLLTTTISFAQKGSWSIGIASGLRSEIFHGSKWIRNYSFGTRISTPPIEINFAYGINDNFVFESGLTYIEAKTNWRFGAVDYGIYGIYCERYSVYNSLQAPLGFKYYLPIAKSNFSFFTKIGLNIQIPLKKYDMIAYFPDVITIDYSSNTYNLEYEVQIKSPTKMLSFLVSAGMGLSYYFNSGIRLSLYGEYYAGIQNTADILLRYTLIDMTTNKTYFNKYTEGLSYRGDYWNVGLGISYTFGKK